MRSPVPIKKNFFRYVPLLILGLLLLIVYSWGLSRPAEPYFDEVHYVRFIRGLLNENRFLDTSNVHPPLWHLLTAGAFLALGDCPIAWRLISLIAGMILFIPLFLIARQITGSKTIAFLTVFLLAFDCISLTQARSAMMNSLMLLFLLWCTYYFLGAFPPGQGIRRNYYCCCGLFLGLAIATKLVSLSLYLFLLPLLMLEWYKRKNERGLLVRDAGIFLLVIPALCFAASYLFVPFLKDRGWHDIWGIWRFHMNYNLTMDQTHGYSSRWWSWPLMLRPIWFYFSAQRWGNPHAMMSGILCIGNPGIFWMMPVAVLNLALLCIFRKSRAAGIILLGFLTQWLCFGLARRLQFFHYFYSVMPFTVMAMALLARQLWEWNGFWRVLVVVYLIAVAVMFVYWYPFLTGIPVSGDYYNNHIWFKSWI